MGGMRMPSSFRADVITRVVWSLEEDLLSWKLAYRTRNDSFPSRAGFSRLDFGIHIYVSLLNEKGSNMPPLDGRNVDQTAGSWPR